MPTPLQYIKTLEEPRRADMEQLHKLIVATIPSKKPFVMQSAHGTIIGYGKCPYETKSGCKGDWFVVGLASRKQGIALYICSAKNGKYLTEYYTKKLPKAKVGKSCVMLKKLVDNNMNVIEDMIREAGELGMAFA